ncbi:hypothetical protein KKA14_07135 [bacterium]|nr:hypothetical protein [bacterium]
MTNRMKSFLILICVISLQIIVYIMFLRPVIFSWGATEDETKMSLVGDSLAPYISSTRAISINAPISEVWKWIIQLGADRGGFFSYEFIEKSLGYKGRSVDKTVPESQDMKVGRVVPGSLDETLIEYSWPVLAVEPGKSFVLKNWGAFVLKEVNARETRLIVRTHGRETPNLISVIGDFFMMPLHYLMERRMLMEFKVRAEGRDPLSPTVDIMWFFGLLLSCVGIISMIFISRGLYRVLVSAFYSVVWLWPLLVFDPHPIHSIGLLLIVSLTATWFVIDNRLHQAESVAQ